MVDMTTISEAVAVGRSKAGRAAAPAEAKAVPAEPRAADPAPAQAKAQPAAPNEPGPGAPSRSPRRLIIPLIAVGAAAALVLVTSARWNAWVGAAAVQTTDNATVHVCALIRGPPPLGYRLQSAEVKRVCRLAKNID
jgi:hypothetical protein